MVRAILALLLGLSLLAPQLMGVLRIGAAPPGGGDNTAAVLSGSDITYLGACLVPDPGSFSAGLAQSNITVRNIAGTDYLYSYGYDGSVQEYTPCADADLSTTAPITHAGTTTKTFADIFGSTICTHAGGPGVAPDTCGLANAVFPVGLSWIDAQTKMYATRYVGYETTNTDYDLGVWRGTINRSNGTGAGEGMWALAYRPNHNVPDDPINDALVNVGNRWVNGVVQIPSWFQAYTSGRDIAIGMGSPGISTVNQGPVNYGIALYAVNSTTLGATTNLGVMGGANMTKLAAYPAGLSGNVRMSHGGISAYQVINWSHEETKIDGPGASNDKVVWTDNTGAGSWIDGTNHQAFVIPYIFTAGTLDTTISSSSAANVLTVASIGDALIGDTIMFQTDWTACNATDYPYARGFISGIAGSVITLDPTTEACADDASGLVPVTNRPLGGGWLHEGSQYLGGGSWSSRAYTVLLIFDPLQLKAVATGARSPSNVNPVAIYQMPLAGTPQPFNMQNNNHTGAGVSSTYSPTTKRLYIYGRFLWQRAVNDAPGLIHVFSIGA